MLTIENLHILEKEIGHKFENISYLKNALTHSSFHKCKTKNITSNEITTNKIINNERMEFLGDKILGFIIAEEIYNRFSNQKEGYLSKCLSYLTSSDILLKVAKQLELTSYIRKNNEDKSSILINACEAIIASIFLDTHDINKCREFILGNWEEYIVEYLKGDVYVDFNPKSFIQEWAQKLKLPIPSYKLINKEGEEHNPKFYVKIVVQGYQDEIGIGSNKKIAEKNAANKFIQNNIQK